MTTSTGSGRLHDPLAFAFAPIHKGALGVATGLVTGLFIFVVTVLHVIAQPAGGLPLELLGQYFHGYTVTWLGALVGFLWGVVTGFVMGFFGAFVRNTTVAIYVFTLKTKAELQRTADFLDHI
ncbi:MAG: hypothetical protein H0W18_18380 [Acidobacteria bacterium]|nr:hypothetical protein [Acidobacteriota bacterium]